MDSLDLDVLATVRRWVAAGHRFVLVTVVRTWGSAPRPPGAWLALRSDGLVAGSVSGGCVEDDLIVRLREGRLAGATPFTVSYGVTREDAGRFGLPCGGILLLLVEPAPDPVLLDDLAARIGRGELVARYVSVAAAPARLEPARRGDALAWDGEMLTTIHGPRWRLLIIGAGQLARVLAGMARALDYEVLVCDPREEHAAEWDVPGTRLLAGMPDDVVVELAPDPHTAVD